MLLAGCVVLLGGAAYVAYASGWPFRPSLTPPPTSDGQAKTAGSGRTAPAGEDAPTVHLDALDADRPAPDSAGRNLFRFKPKPAPPPPPPVLPRAPSTADVAAPPAGPPPPPPITLKFIAIFDEGPPKKVMAILSDGRGTPVHAREGETVFGQYRILRIGTESIEMSYLDGRGRQTIRLSGS